jgi:hypothetical protein
LYLHFPAAARAAVAAHDPSDRFLYAASQEILEGDAAREILEKPGIKAVLVRADPDERGWGERVALHFVYVECETLEIVGAPEVFVGSVSFAVYAIEYVLEAVQTSLLAVDFSAVSDDENLYYIFGIFDILKCSVTANSKRPLYRTTA